MASDLLSLSNSPYYIHESGTLIYINSNITKSEFNKEVLEKENLKEESTTILMFKDGAIINQATGRSQEIKYSDLNLDVNKDSVVSLLNGIKWVGVLIALVFIIGMFLGHMFSALIVAVLSVLVGAVMKVKLEFGQLYKLSIYALTLPTILAVVNTFAGSVVPKFYYIYILCAVVYMGFAMKAIKDNNYNNNEVSEL